MKLALQWGYTDRSKINQIAEGKIASYSDVPSAIICELAMHTDDLKMMETLNVLSQSSDQYAVLVELIKTYVRPIELTQEEVFKLSSLISNYAEWNDNKELSCFNILQMRISDARWGIYADENTLKTAVDDFVKKLREIAGIGG